MVREGGAVSESGRAVVVPSGAATTYTFNTVLDIEDQMHEALVAETIGDDALDEGSEPSGAHSS